MPFSGRVSAALARRGVHYGWVVVATTFLTMLVAAGAVGAQLIALWGVVVGLGTGLTALVLAAGLVLLVGRAGGGAVAAGPAGT